MATSNLSPLLAAAGRAIISLSAEISNFAGALLRVTPWMLRPTESKAILLEPSRKIESECDFAENFFLVDVEAQGNLRMLQIIVAAARVRLIGPELRRGDEDRQQLRERKKRRTTAMAVGVAMGFPDHSALLLQTVCPARSSAAMAAGKVSDARSR